MALKNKNTSTVLIYCFLVVFTGVITVEGERGVNQLKNKPHTVEPEGDDLHTGEEGTMNLYILYIIVHT